METLQTSKQCGFMCKKLQTTAKKMNKMPEASVDT